jgi:DNA-binding NtrC family response regulator
MPVDIDFNCLDGIIGVSPFVKGLRRQIAKIASHSTNVLITGPSGTGKELIARAIHAHSPRIDKPFVAVDCAGASGPLFAGHLFGHVKGAFTGAYRAAPGCFRAAEGGTIFLDEIGELDRDLQAKLLRVLQERVVTPLGSHAPLRIAVRVIAATNCELEQRIVSGLFREDLYYRLNVFSIRTTPLRDRPEDIMPLAQYFLQKMAGRLGVPVQDLSCRCLDCMQRHDWPGNVRELQNFLEQAVVISSDGVIQPDAVRGARGGGSRGRDGALAHHGPSSARSYPADAGADGLQPAESSRIIGHASPTVAPQNQEVRPRRLFEWTRTAEKGPLTAGRNCHKTRHILDNCRILRLKFVRKRMISLI